MDHLPARLSRFLDVDAESRGLPATSPSVSCSHGAWCLLDLDLEPPRFYFASSLSRFAPGQPPAEPLALRVEDLGGADLGWRIVLDLAGHSMAFLCGGDLDPGVLRQMEGGLEAEVSVRYVEPSHVLAVEHALQDCLEEWLEQEELAEGSSPAARALHRDGLLESGVLTYWTALVEDTEARLPQARLGRVPLSAGTLGPA